jgi:hypothetical protein
MKRQIVAFSGGKDSTALALEMVRRREPIHGLLVTPTGDELPAVWKHWDAVAEHVGAPVIRPKAPSLAEAIESQKALPNFRMRWCTRLIKIAPMIAWAKTEGRGATVCVGLRADEPARTGIISEHVPTRFPLREWGMGLEDVMRVIAKSPFSVPKRTDCARCYHQRIHEWWDLWHEHPDIFESAVQDEHRTGHTYRTPGRDTWPVGLAELRTAFADGRIPKKRANLELFSGEEEMCRVCSL